VRSKLTQALAGPIIRRTRWLLIATAVAASLTLVPLASAGAFHLRVAIPWRGGDAACVVSYRRTVDCHPHLGGPVAAKGLGFVSQSYLFAVETDPGPACVGGFYVVDYPARLIVAGKGEIFLSLDPVEACLYGPPSDTVLRPSQAFTVTGGSGLYAGASGSGVVTRTNVGRPVNAPGYGTDVWEGTLVVPGLNEFDLTRPTLAAPAAKVVRAPRTAKWVRVRFRLAATDNVDGSLPVACRPRSGSRFRVGHRTLVRCSATDTSANTASASFTVTVTRRR
jgi:HYR domain